MLSAVVLLLLNASPVHAGPGGSSGGELSLRELADARGLRVGAAADTEPVLAGNDAYLTTLGSQYNHITTANALKWDQLRPTRESWNFAAADKIVEFARAKRMTVQGHTLVWHVQQVSWLNTISSEAEARAVLEEHIKTVVGRYRGVIKVWDVVNEALDENGNRRSAAQSIWERLIGPEYIELAFRWAHEADPDAVLQYNDYGAEDMNFKSNAVYALVRDLRAKGVPIQAVGWQLHVPYGWRLTEAHWRNANRLAQLGVRLSVTEFDYGLPVPVTAEKLADQGRAYREITEFCVTQPACTTLTTWGFTDRYSWIPGERPDHDAGLPFDRDYGGKPALAAIRDALAATATVAPARPRILDAVAAQGRVTIGWRGVPGADRYTIRYGTSPARLTHHTTIGRDTAHVLTGLADRTRYYFSVQAGNAHGAGPASPAVTATPTAVRPGAAALVGLRTDARALLLHWDRAAGATGYAVEYGRVSDGDFTGRVEVGRSTRYRLTGLTDGTAYQVRVIASNGNGDGPASSARTAIPAVPPTPQMSAARATAPVTVDGRLEEADWRRGAPVAETVLGSTGNRVVAGFTWDETYLYVGVRVADDTLINDSHDVYQDDSVELYLDGDNDRAPAYDPLTDRHFFQGWNDAALTESGGNISGVRHAWAPRRGGYAVELAVPWQSLGIRPAQGSTVGVDVGVNDDDDGVARDGQLVAFGTETNWQDLSAVAALTLTGPDDRSRAWKEGPATR